MLKAFVKLLISSNYFNIYIAYQIKMNCTDGQVFSLM